MYVMLDDDEVELSQVLEVVNDVIDDESELVLMVVHHLLQLLRLLVEADDDDELALRVIIDDATELVE